jgi:hypothetical protein
MPTIFRRGGYRFHFYTNEGNEPCHIHVEGRDGEAKFWVPSCELVFCHGLGAAELRRIRRIVLEKKREIEEAWNEIHPR